MPLIPQILAQVRYALWDMQVYKKQRPPPPVKADILFPELLNIDTVADTPSSK